MRMTFSPKPISKSVSSRNASPASGRQSSRPNSKQQRKQLLALAKTWMTAASLLESDLDMSERLNECRHSSHGVARKQLLPVAKSGRIEVVAAHGDALARAEAIWRDEYA